MTVNKNQTDHGHILKMISCGQWNNIHVRGPQRKAFLLTLCCSPLIFSTDQWKKKCWKSESHTLPAELLNTQINICVIGEIHHAVSPAVMVLVMVISLALLYHMCYEKLSKYMTLDLQNRNEHDHWWWEKDRKIKDW